MAITFVTSAVAESASAGVGCTATISGAQAGDLILVIGSNTTYLNGAATYATVKNGAAVSFTRVTQLSNLATITSCPQASIEYKFWADSNDNSIVIGVPVDPNGGSNCVVFVFRGVDPSTPIDVTTTTASGNSTNPNCPAVTPASNNCCIVAAASGGGNDSSPGAVTSFTQPSPFVIAGQPWGTTRNLTTAMSYRILTGNAGVSQNPAAYASWSSSRWVAFTIALRPLSNQARSAGYIIG